MRRALSSRGGFKAVKFSPRQQRTLAALLLSACTVAPAPAQRRAPEAAPRPPHAQDARPAPAARPKGTSGASAAAKKNRQRQRQAVALLAEAAEAARSFDDPFHAARVQAQAAEALWPFDEQTARAALRRAWEAAVESDQADTEELKEKVEPGGEAPIIKTARYEVLAAAARRDARLADSFFQEWDQATAGAGGAAGAGQANGARPPSSPAEAARAKRGAPSEGGEQRLQFAYFLLEQGEHRRAAEVAAPVAEEGVSAALVAFILRLHARSPTDAAALYLQLLERTSASAEANANDVLLLSSPVVSPKLLVDVDELGGARMRPVFYEVGSDRAVLPDLPRPARDAFFRVAAGVLLRPTPAPPGDAERRAASLALYFAVGRLLPFFEREAAQYAPGLAARQTALAAEIEAASRDALASQMNVSSLTSQNPTDPLRSYFDEIARARDDSDRDSWRVLGVAEASRHMLWDRARRLADEIEDAGTRHTARQIVTSFQVINLSKLYAEEDADEFEEAARFVREADVPPLVRAHGFGQAAALAARAGQRGRASELLGEAALAAAPANAGKGTGQHVGLFAALAVTAARFDAPRAWEFFSSALRSAEEAEDLNDSNPFDVPAYVWIPIRGGAAAARGESLDFAQIWAAMARLDFARSLGEARLLGDEALRGYALVAIARAALERKEAGGGRKAGRP